jgi:hypothetical protein
MEQADGVLGYLDEPGIMQARDAATRAFKWGQVLKRGVGQLLQPLPLGAGLLFVMDRATDGTTPGPGRLEALDLADRAILRTIPFAFGTRMELWHTN